MMHCTKKPSPRSDTEGKNLMANGPDEFDELTREIRYLIKDNKRFLERVREEDFEPEEGEEETEESMEDFEEL